jgi:hypothetical protein
MGEADIFIAAHCLEHIRGNEIEYLYNRIKNSNIKYCLLDIPITDKPVNWSEYEGTHILEIGYSEIIKLFSQHFDLIKRNNTFTLWERKR